MSQERTMLPIRRLLLASFLATLLVPMARRAQSGSVLFWGIAFAACALGAQMLAWLVLSLPMDRP